MTWEKIICRDLRPEKIQAKNNKFFLGFGEEETSVRRKLYPAALKGSGVREMSRSRDRSRSRSRSGRRDGSRSGRRGGGDQSPRDRSPAAERDKSRVSATRLCRDPGADGRQDA